MRFQHQTVKHLLNLVARQYVMSQKQFLSSSKLKTCMSVLHVLPCKLGIVISRCIVYVARCLGSKPARTEGKRDPSLAAEEVIIHMAAGTTVFRIIKVYHTLVSNPVGKTRPGLISGFSPMKLLGVCLLPTGLESSRLQGYPPALSLLVPIYKYSHVERGIVRVKCLAY